MYSEGGLSLGRVKGTTERRRNNIQNYGKMEQINEWRVK